jgi:hypothetical protein
MYFCTDYRSELCFTISPKLSEGQAYFEVGRFIGMPGRQPETKSLFILQCYDTFRVIGRRKQHTVPNVSISFVSSVDLVPL